MIFWRVYNKIIKLIGADRMVGGADKRWSLEFLKEVAGKKPVQPKRRVDDSAAWARLEPCAEVLLWLYLRSFSIEKCRISP